MKNANIDIDAIEKRFAQQPVVRDFSLQIAPGEFVSLLGPSGSGKTTLLMMIAGFEQPDRGRISIGSRDITFLAPNKRDVGMVFQRYALFPHMTVAQNLAFPLRMRGVRGRRAADRVEEMLSLVQLGGYEARLPGQLSGGQQQRVAVARALIAAPPVLLMDEPLSALDKKLRESMQVEIKRIQRQVGVTVVYVTHDQDEALTMSDRVAVMSEGRLVQAGSPEDLYLRPASAFVAGFVGRMNFLSGHYLGEEQGRAVVRLRSGALVRLAGGRVMTAGAPVELAIRPEHLTLSPSPLGSHSPYRPLAPSTPAEQLPACEALAAVVEAVTFTGPSRIVSVRLTGEAADGAMIDQGQGQDLSPDAAGAACADRIEIHQPAASPSTAPGPGDAVVVTTSADAFHLYPSGQGECR